MDKRFKKILKISIPLFLGIFLIWYSLKSSTEAERENLWLSIIDANKFWIFVSFALGSLSHLSRAYRWKFMLEPMGYKTSLPNRFMAVMIAYVANFGIPRSGEVLRAATLTTYEKVPFEKGFGTIISERVADLVMLMLIVCITLFLQTDDLLGYLENQNIEPLNSFLILISLIIVAIIGLTVIKRSSWGPFKKIKKLARGLLDGMKSILYMRQKWAFLFHTLFIWTLYLLMFLVIKLSIPETVDATFSAIMAAFVVGSFAVSATNGGIGVYPLAVAGVLTFFGVQQNGAEAFGWISWATQTFVVLIFGGLSFIFLPLLNNRK